MLQPISTLLVVYEGYTLLNWRRDFIYNSYTFIHLRLERTHGYVADELLMQNGYPPTVIKVQPAQRLRYYETMETASVRGNVVSFVQLMQDWVEESLQPYPEIIGR